MPPPTSLTCKEGAKEALTRLSYTLHVAVVPLSDELAGVLIVFVPRLLASVQSATVGILLAVDVEDGISTIRMGVHDAILIGTDDETTGIDEH